MMLYALVGPSNAVDRYDSNVDPNVATKTGWRWLPVTDTRPLAGDNQIVEGPTVTVLADSVTRVWTVRDLTAGELDAQKTDLVESEILTVVGKVLFNHENRVRALEGKAAITADQFKTALKALL